MRYGRIRTGAARIKIKSLTRSALVGIAVAGLSAAAIFPAIAGASSQSTIYNNIPNSTPSNVPSVGFEATSSSEFGSQVTFDGSARKNPKVTVLMSSWACKSGTWNGGNCITNSGSTFTHPVTLNVYNVNDDDTPGSLIKSETKTFNMPYRPTADDGTNCNAANGKAGQWWDGASCVNGKAFKISFDLDNVTLPDNVIIGVAYNTTHYGYSPIGTKACNSTPQGCPYDSLNVGTNPAPTVGSSEPTDDDAYYNTSYGPFYCDGGTGGAGVFRLDSGCWTGYLPAIKVEANPGKNGHSKPPHRHKHYNYDKNHHNKYKSFHGFYNLWND